MNRVKKYTIKVSRHRSFLVYFRKFRTKSNSNQLFKISLNINGLREIAVKSKISQKKHTNNLIPGLIIISGLFGLIYFSFNLTSQNVVELAEAYNIPASHIQGSSDEEEIYTLERSRPINLNIASIKVNAPVMIIGQNPDKTIEVPPFHEYITGWYKNGPAPGELGPAVILGHVDSTKGPSVFWGLNKINPGDEIVIEREDGKKVKYIVDRLEQFDQNSFPTEEVYGNINHVGLRLITCGGTFNREVGRYSHNTVVFASAEIIATEKEADFIRAKTFKTGIAIINELKNN